MRSLQDSLQMLAAPLAVGQAKALHLSPDRSVVLRRVGQAALSVTIGVSDQSPELLLVGGEPAAIRDQAGFFMRPYHVDRGLLPVGDEVVKRLQARAARVLHAVAAELAQLPEEAVPVHRYPVADSQHGEGITIYALPSETGKAPWVPLVLATLALRDEDEPSGFLLCERAFRGAQALHDARRFVRQMTGADVTGPVAVA